MISREDRLAKERARVAAYYSANKDKVSAYKKAWAEKNKVAIGLRNAAYRAENKEKIKTSDAAYYEKNRAEINARNRAYAAANKSKINERISVWRRLNPEKTKLYCAVYRAENSGKWRVYNQNRRALKKANGGCLSGGIVQKLLVLQKGKCVCCGKSLGNNYHLDHIMPLSLGGANEDSNVQLLRQECNNQKHSKHPIDFMRQRGKLL